MSATWGAGDVILFTHVGGVFRVAASWWRARGPGVPRCGNPRRSQSAAEPELPAGRSPLRVRPAAVQIGRRTVICVAALDTKEEQCIAKVASPARYAAPGYLLLVRDGALRLQRFDVDRLALSGEAIPVTTSPVRVLPVFRPPPFSIAASALAFHRALPRRNRRGAIELARRPRSWANLVITGICRPQPMAAGWRRPAQTSATATWTSG